jgi:hypothetical protein
MIQLFFHGSKAALNVPQTFTKGQLGERHAQELIKTCKRADAVVSLVALDAAPKLPLGQKIHNLGEHRAPLIHNPSPFASS